MTIILDTSKLTSASESRAVTVQIILNIEQAQLDDAIARIEEAKSKGEFETTLYGTGLREPVVAALKAERYRVNTNFGRNESDTVISWKNPVGDGSS